MNIDGLNNTLPLGDGVYLHRDTELDVFVLTTDYPAAKPATNTVHLGTAATEALRAILNAHAEASNDSLIDLKHDLENSAMPEALIVALIYGYKKRFTQLVEITIDVAKGLELPDASMPELLKRMHDSAIKTLRG